MPLGYRLQGVVKHVEEVHSTSFYKYLDTFILGKGNPAWGCLKCVEPMQVERLSQIIVHLYKVHGQYGLLRYLEEEYGDLNGV